MRATDPTFPRHRAKTRITMVKGRRKRAPTRNGISTRSRAPSVEHDEFASPIKKETKLDNKKAQSNGSARTRAVSQTCKSPVCITSYFYTQITNTLSPEVKLEEDTILKTEPFFSSEQMDDLPKDILTDVGHFRTDETPVAVPIQEPSTPHRINMPNSQMDDSDEGIVAMVKEEKPKLITAIPHTPIQQQMKKPAARGRRKLIQTSPAANHRLTTESTIKSTNHKLTEFFPVRRSVRKSKKAVLEEKQRDIENKVLCQVEEGLKVERFPGKGRGVVTTREFAKGEFVVEYIGELVDQVVAKKREKLYAQDQNKGCYMYYFQHRNHQYCVDATEETDKLGRLVNHSRNGNLIARVVEVETTPHLVLTAKEDIPIGTEVTYDYGDRSREAIRHHPWLAL